MFEIWTKDRNGKEALLITDLPTRALADKLAANVREMYGDTHARVEQI